MADYTIYRSSIIFYLNGNRIVVENPNLDLTLLQYLRSTGLTGTKLGCGEGGCGACTVMVSRYDTNRSKIVHCSVNACLYPFYAVDGKHIITVEGLGNTKNPHPVQERIALLHGSQCGFCTPGFVMSLYTLLRNNPNPSELEIEECFDGNLCRCTGYRPILDAAKTFADQAWKPSSIILLDGTVRVAPVSPADSGCNIDGCCQTKSADTEPSASCCGNSGDSETACCRSKLAVESNQALSEKLETISKFKKYDPTQELIFPPFLIRYAKDTVKTDEPQRKSLKIMNPDTEGSWCKLLYRPANLTQLLEILEKHPESKIVAGNTRVGIDIKFNHSRYPVQVYINDIPELCQTTHSNTGIAFGGNLTLSQFVIILDEIIAKHAETETVYCTQNFVALREVIKCLGNNQVRSVATIAGNIASASPISNLSPVLLSSGSSINLASSQCTRSVPMSEFIIGHGKTAMHPGEVILSIDVPYSRRGECAHVFKQTKKIDKGTTIVVAGFRVHINPDTKVVLDATFAYGGMSSTAVVAKSTSDAAVGDTWGDSSLLSKLITKCQQEMCLDYSIPGGMAEYRNTLAVSLLFKFWVVSCSELGIANDDSQFAEEMKFNERNTIKSLQEYASIKERVIVGKGVAHLSALKHATGEARYTDDIPAVNGELHIGLVMSKYAHARILSIDTSRALELPGVHKVLTYKDIPGPNLWNILQDEEILASEEVHYVGQPIALVIADTQKIAQEAARSAVDVKYEVLPAIISIREAIEKQSFFPEVREIKYGNVEDAFNSESDFVFEGESYCGPQEHFYLEPMAAVVVPKGEGDEYDIYSTSQSLNHIQMSCSEVLGIPSSRIVAHAKRLGGAFGGKESYPTLLSIFATLAAYHTSKPTRIVLDREQDMQITGQRHAFLGKWKVGVARDGRLKSLCIKLYSNGGFSYNYSVFILERSLLSLDNCYKIPNIHSTGRICKTNIQSSTSFRGFGSCQGMLMLESMMSEVADKLGIPVEHIREVNMYKKGDTTPFMHKIENDWNVPLMWKQIKEKAEYEKRRREVDEFNARSKYCKRGFALIPTKYSISYGINYLNQGMSLVHIYTDGSVLVAHGGVEMGQGLHTKMAMVAAEVLELPLESIFTNESATNITANTSPTSASMGSDLNGFAVYNACMILKERLKPYREKYAGEAFSTIAKMAYLDRCNLTASGHFKAEEGEFDWEKGRGRFFFYFTQGVAAAEVELDTLTGSHTVKRVDIIMDTGESLNKALDIGQIEGAFVQGQGWTTCEEFLYSPSDGSVLTKGPREYRIPESADIPRDFRVSLLEGIPRSTLKSIYSSKGIGEPPLFLGSSVFFALRDAVRAARKHSTPSHDIVHLESPATPEILRLACQDHLSDTAKIPDEAKEGKVPYSLRI